MEGCPKKMEDYLQRFYVFLLWFFEVQFRGSEIGLQGLASSRRRVSIFEHFDASPFCLKRGLGALFRMGSGGLGVSLSEAPRFGVVSTRSESNSFGSSRSAGAAMPPPRFTVFLHAAIFLIASWGARDEAPPVPHGSPLDPASRPLGPSVSFEREKKDLIKRAPWKTSGLFDLGRPAICITVSELGIWPPHTHRTSFGDISKLLVAHSQLHSEVKSCRPPSSPRSRMSRSSCWWRGSEHLSIACMLRGYMQMQGRRLLWMWQKQATARKSKTKQTHANALARDNLSLHFGYKFNLPEAFNISVSYG